MEFQLEEPGDVPFVWNAADRVRQEQKVRERYPDAFAARYYFNMNHDPVGLMEADRHGYDRMSDAELETQGVYRRSENRPRNMSGISLTPIPINDLARRRFAEPRLPREVPMGDSGYGNLGDIRQADINAQAIARDAANRRDFDLFARTGVPLNERPWWQRIFPNIPR
jgi:hypothetical protein